MVKKQPTRSSVPKGAALVPPASSMSQNITATPSGLAAAPRPRRCRPLLFFFIRLIYNTYALTYCALAWGRCRGCKVNERDPILGSAGAFGSAGGRK